MKAPEANDPLESELRHALRHVDPPAGFADRVIQRAAMGSAGHGISARPLAAWATAAALAVAVSGGLWYRAEERHRAEGEEARRQVLRSLEITSTRLRAVQMKINHQGESQQ
jgi:hypothetical protein